MVSHSSKHLSKLLFVILYTTSSVCSDELQINIQERRERIDDDVLCIMHAWMMAPIININVQSKKKKRERAVHLRVMSEAFSYTLMVNQAERGNMSCL